MYSVDRGFAQGSDFGGGGVTNTNSKVSAPVFPKTAIFGPISTRIFFARKAALTVDGSRVNDP